MQKKFRLFCSIPPSFLLYFFIRRVSPEGAWPAEIQPAARLLAFQLGLSAPLLCSLFDASLSFSLSLEAVRGVRRSAIFGAAAFYFGNRAVQTKRNDFGLCREMGPRAARRGAGGRTRTREGGQSVGRSVVFLPHWNGLIFLARQIWRNRGREPMCPALNQIANFSKATLRGLIEGVFE